MTSIPVSFLYHVVLRFDSKPSWHPKSFATKSHRKSWEKKFLFAPMCELRRWVLHGILLFSHFTVDSGFFERQTKRRLHATNFEQSNYQGALLLILSRPQWFFCKCLLCLLVFCKISTALLGQQKGRTCFTWYEA